MSDSPEPFFLSLDQVMPLHLVSLAKHGGIAGARDSGAIESALVSAQNAWFYANADLFEIAAAYAFHIAQSQAFLDGNKRTGAASAIAFLTSNGCVDRSSDGAIYDAMIAIAER